ncbi:MAG: dTDP-4-dehydrorhamnose reductase [Chloroflexi bacterium]|nr:MAG: dTDP-4-dehydrorhamnose reductase [Chloroflexota bacterium]
MSRRLLITGGSGHLGRVVAAQAVAAGWAVTATFLRAAQPIAGVHWQQLDVRDRLAVERVIGDVQPDAVIHTAVVEPNDWATNADGAAHVALAAQRLGTRLVHVSSDAIFNGASGLYGEDALPEPINPYGAAKAAAETAVRAIQPSAAIVRTSLIIGDEAYKHVRLVLDMLEGKNDGALFTDEIRCPIHVQDLAAALLELAAPGYAGVLNVAGPDALNRYELGRLIARRWGYDPAALRASTTVESGLRRPTDVRLDCVRAHQLLRTQLRGATLFLQT